MKPKLRRDHTETGPAVTESRKSLALQLELKGPCCDAAGCHIHASALNTEVRIRRCYEDINNKEQERMSKSRDELM